MKSFWLFWWDAVLTYMHGEVVRSRGARVLFVDERTGELLRGYLSAVGSLSGKRQWYVRDENHEAVYAVAVHDRGVTWVRGWEGEAADAFRASHLLTRSAA
jgi:hypothetical protein